MYKIDEPIRRFEKEIFLSLEGRGLIEKSKPPLFYIPSSPDENRVQKSYANLKRGFINHGKAIGLAALGGAAFAHILNPEFAPQAVKWLGALGGIVISVRILDEYLSQDQSDKARSYFKNKPKNWMDPYTQLELGDKQSLDEYILIAQMPSAIYNGKSNIQSETALGVGIAKIADILSAIRADSKKIKGLDLEHLIAMLPQQKSRSDRDKEIINSLTTIYSLKKLVEELKKPSSDLEGLDVLRQYVDSYEFVLRTSSIAELQSIGAMLSKGYIVVEQNAGPNTASHAGVHSIGKDCPRVLVKEHARHSFMTRAKRGVGVVCGNADHDLMKQAEGGICLVKGKINGLIAQNMTDSTWPAIIISVGGVEYELRNSKEKIEGTKNGLIISLNEASSLNKEQAEIALFEDGKMQLSLFDKSTALEPALAKVREYVLGWKSRLE